MDFFRADSKFFSIMGKLFHLMILNVVFLVMCLPVVTIGANCTALSYVTLKLNEEKDRKVFRNYWRAFLQNFRQATMIWLPVLLLAVITGYDVFLAGQLGPVHRAFRIALLSFLLLPAVLLTYVFPLLSRFENTLRQTVKNAVLMALRHLPWTLMMLIVELFPVIMYVFGQPETAAGTLLVMLICGFSGISYICSWFFTYKIFPCYIPGEGDDET